MKKLYSENPIFLKSFEEFNQVKLYYNIFQKYQYNCIDCNKLFTTSYNALKTKGSLRCTGCGIKFTKIQRFGSLENLRVLNTAKIKQTKKERYGDENYNNVEKQKETWKRKSKEDLEAIVQKRKETWSQKTVDEKEATNRKRKQTKKKLYGNENYVNREKFEKTCLERYGCKAPLQNKEVLERMKTRSRELYGVDYTASLESVREKLSLVWKERTEIEKEEISEKRRKTYLERNGEDFPTHANKTFKEKYGVGNPSQVMEFQKKKVENWREKYGAEHPMQNSEIFKRCVRKRVLYENLRFDSALEKDFYIHLTKDLGLKLGEDFEMQKRYPKPYFVDGKEHYTFVDFYIKKFDKWIECKGPQFFNKDGTAKLIYGSKKKTEAYYNNFRLWEAKLAFLREENIEIITII